MSKPSPVVPSPMPLNVAKPSGARSRVWKKPGFEVISLGVTGSSEGVTTELGQGKS